MLGNYIDKHTHKQTQKRVRVRVREERKIVKDLLLIRIFTPSKQKLIHIASESNQANN